MKTTRGLFLLLFCTHLSAFADTPINAWIKPGSGDWQDQTAWSLGVRPGVNQTIMLTNQGWKGIAIRSSTAQDFPASLNVDSVIVSGYTDSFNVLLLNYAGTDVPLRAANGLSTADGGQVQNLYSGLIVDNGYLSVSNSQFIQVGGSVATTNATLKVDNGSYNLTNGLLQAGTVYLGLQSTGAAFVQDGGSASMTSLTIGYGLHGSGTYDLYNGWLYVGGSLLLEGPQGSAVFNQHGGTNFASLLDVSSYSGSAAYNLYGGMLCANSAEVSANVAANFTQTGGDAFITNTITIKGYNPHGYSSYVGSWLLSGGTLSARSLDVNGSEGLSIYTQSNGTARISDTISLGSGDYQGNLNLAGGTLSSFSVTFSRAGDSILQTGGALIVSNLFSYGGTWTPYGGYPVYTFTGGTLTANNMELFAQWTIGSSAQTGRLSNPGYFKLGFAALHIDDADEHLGRLILATNMIDSYAPPPVITNSWIALDGNSSRLSFADSHAETWGPGTLLVIANWNGNPAGGGAEQLKVGTSASGLTAAQLARITFSNPSGFPAGNYAANILSTGELVPGNGGTGTSSNINAWISSSGGNWEDQTKWSLGVPPGLGQTIMLTNQGWKAIAIGPNTAQNFPATLNVDSVILGGYTDSFNLLLLNYAGYQIPLQAGSVNVGTNSGVTALASVLTVSSNSGPGDLSIFSTFNQGEQANVNAHLINLGDFLNPAPGFGTYNQTNGIVNADEVSEAFGSTFNQFAGANTIGTLWMGAASSTSNFGRYNMVNGYLTAGSIELYRGDFNQMGGAVAAGLSLGDGTYRLSGGILNLPGITIPNVPYSQRNPGFTGMGGSAVLLQTGGTNFCNGPMLVYNEGDALVNVPFDGAGSYVLSNGVLFVSGTVRSWLTSFQQWGGWHTNAGTEVAGDTFPNFEIRTGSFTLGGGTLITPSINIDLGTFTQPGGTNRVSGGVIIGTDGSPATFNLSGGLLTDSTTFVDGSNNATPGGQSALFTQSGGTHMVTNLLRLSGQPPDYQPPNSVTSYVFSNGALNAPNIQIDNKAFFEHDGGTLTTSGLLTLGYGSWTENTTGQQFGRLLLSAPSGSNATFSLPSSGACIIHFANSSSVAWSNNAGLTIKNWHGSTSGGGATQFYFGSNSSGLTPQQLAQIRFNTSGSLQPARILATGEVVPGSGPQVQFTRNGNTMSLTWGPGSFLQSSTSVAGPYQDVPGATSPYTINMTKPMEYFRLRQ